MKDKGQRTRDGGTDERKQRRKGQDQRDTYCRATKKGTLGQLIERVQRSGDKEQSCERGDRGGETKYKEGTKDVRQGRGKGTEERVT
jgi:hypothetical protein